jgi:hypothetical protein
MNTKEFIQKSTTIHGLKYNYSKTIYTKSNINVCIICPIHGEFFQLPGNHLKGRGCKYCARNFKLTTKEFIKRAKEKHGNRYDYSLVNYTRIGALVIIICPIHGEFFQIAELHLNGKNCLKCSYIDRGKKKRNSIEKWISSAEKTHNKFFDYSKSVYSKAKNKIEIICPKHGSFWQEANSHLRGIGCPKCSTLGTTKPHQEIIDFIKNELCISHLTENNRSIITPKELDIYLPDYKIAIELNGLYYHSFNKTESTEERQKHLIKFKLCQEKGIQLLQIREDEWNNPIKQEIWKSILRNKLGLSNKIPARKTKFIPITTHEANEFLIINHLQGTTNQIKYSYGLQYQNELVGVITFCGHQKEYLNLSRMAFKLNTNIVGGASKLFKNALKYLPKKDIITFSNNLYSSGKIYEILGFKKEKELPCSYEWWKVNTKNLYNKRQFRHKFLVQKLESYNPKLTEAENMFANNYRRIWDAGYSRFLFADK